jgi:hypothetical protein
MTADLGFGKNPPEGDYSYGPELNDAFTFKCPRSASFVQACLQNHHARS